MNKIQDVIESLVVHEELPSDTDLAAEILMYALSNELEAAGIESLLRGFLASGYTSDAVNRDVRVLSDALDVIEDAGYARIDPGLGTIQIDLLKVHDDFDSAR